MSAALDNDLAGPSIRRPGRTHYADDNDDGFDFGLSDLLPEPESPTPIPYSYATYPVPDDLSLDLPEGRRQVITRLVGSHPLWGHYLWNTSRVLSTYLLRNPELFKKRRILELGAGAGLPSLISAAGGASHVLITDYPSQELIENINWNVECNVARDDLAKINVEGFVWGADIKPLLRKGRQQVNHIAESEDGFDVIILSDLVFNHSQHPALIASVNALLAPISPEPSPFSSSPDLATTPCLLIFITHHRPHLAQADMAFFPLLAESGSGWAYEQIVEEYAGAMFEDDPGDEKTRGTVKGWRAWRVRDGEVRGERKNSGSSTNGEER